MNEEWKDIKGFEGCYAVSNLGRVKSLPRVVNSKPGTSGRPIPEKIMKFSTTRDGYSRVGLKRSQKSYQRSVHRLVAQAFIPNPENKPTVNHEDLYRTNNCVDNLSWMTESEQQKHLFRVGARREDGEHNAMAKLTDTQVAEIRSLYVPRTCYTGRNPRAGLSQRSIADRFGINQVTVSRIVTLRSRVHN